MTTTDTLTARKLYDTDATMRAFIASWDAERRCPMPLVDFLLEQGLESAAEAARWAATEKKRPVRLPLGSQERDGDCGPFPTQRPQSRTWFWDNVPGFAASLPFQGMSNQNEPTPTDAIVWLLDAWRLPT